MVSDVVNQLSLSNAAGWGAAAGFGAGVTPARLCSGCFTCLPLSVFQPSMYFLLLSVFPGHVGAGFPQLKTATPAAGAGLSLPALPGIVVQRWSTLRPL